MEGKKFLMVLEKEYFQKENKKVGVTYSLILDKIFNHKLLKMLTSKQILQRSPRTLAQTKTSNTTEKLLNEIR